MIKVNVEYIDWIKKYSDVCELDKVRLYKKIGGFDNSSEYKQKA